MATEARSLDQTCWIVVIQNLNFVVQNLEMSSRKIQRRHREGSRGIALAMLIVGTRGALVFNASPRPLFPGKEPRYP